MRDGYARRTRGTMVLSVRRDGSTPAPTPADEQERLAAMRSYGILDTSPDPRFDRITELAARTFDTAMALIVFVDDDRQWFKSAVGVEERATPRDWSFCSHSILQDGAEPMVVHDTHLDARFETNPLVVGPPRVRFYAGARLTTQDGYKLGTLCVVDTAPREKIDRDQSDTLKLMAKFTLDMLEFHKLEGDRR